MMVKIARALAALFLVPWAILSFVFALACLLISVGERGPQMWLLAMLFAVMGSVLVRTAYRLVRARAPLFRRRHFIDPLPPELQRMKRVPIRDAAELKRVMIVGKVRIAKKLKAPLSERPCCYYDARVYDESGVTVVRETAHSDFFVDDGTGRALVKGAVATVKLDAVYRSESGRATSRQIELLRRHNRMPHGALVYREGTLTPGEKVAVIGVGHREPDPEGGASYRDMPTRLVFDGEIICVTDLI